MVYKSIYPFEVLTKIGNGEKVYMVDREDYGVYFVNSAEAEFVVFATDDNTGRYDFWIKEENEVNNNG